MQTLCGGALLRLEHQENNLVVALKIIQKLGGGRGEPGIDVFALLVFLGALSTLFLFVWLGDGGGIFFGDGVFITEVDSGDLAHEPWRRRKSITHSLSEWNSSSCFLLIFSISPRVRPAKSQGISKGEEQTNHNSNTSKNNTDLAGGPRAG